MNRMTPVALPVQSHEAGEVFKLCDTTLDAYSNRLVAAASRLSTLTYSPIVAERKDPLPFTDL